ncbi:hypothetical protein [Massilia sp. TS11]|uniref:hypothetical protein n=1 Tax=Massilia sp. TS11 TaxID=2908003 RepID=UPI001EDB860F|nr:hypothetical protein [Massilia sp. TS11]MCG2583275.1 hypothetical protein [Massilia sp. TS11]
MRLLSAGCLLLPALAWADTGYYLVTTYPVEGEKTVDYKYWKARPTGVPQRSSPEVGVSLNVNGRWYTEFGGVWFDCACTGGRSFASYYWQNDVMLTQGQYDVDVAFHTKIDRMHDSARGYGFEWGPVLQTEIGRTQLNFNLFIQRDLRGVANVPAELVYQAQVKYHHKPALSFGVQAFGEVGPWQHWLPRARQSHRIGPAIFSEIDEGGKPRWKLEAAILTGKNSGRTAKSLTARVQYLF